MNKIAYNFGKPLAGRYAQKEVVMTTQLNGKAYSVDVSFTTTQLIQVAQLAIAAGVYPDLESTEYNSLVHGVNAHVDFRPNEGRALVKLNSVKVEVYFYTVPMFGITHARVEPIEGKVRRSTLVLSGDYWDYYELVNSKVPELYAEIMKGLIKCTNIPYSLFSVMKQVPVITMYERNVKGEEVVRITYTFYIGMDPKLDLYWVYGQHDNGQPYDYFHHGVVTYQNGNEHIWTKED